MPAAQACIAAAIVLRWPWHRALYATGVSAHGPQHHAAFCLSSALCLAYPPQVVLREEEVEPQRRTRIVPQLMERDKYWRVRAAQAGQ